MAEPSSKRLIVLAWVAALTLGAITANALIPEPKAPIAARYKVSKVVLAGTVTKVNPGTNSVEVQVTAGKGNPRPAMFRVQFASKDPKVMAKFAVLAPGAAVAGFQSDDPPVVAVHIADSWFTAMAAGAPASPIWRVNGKLDNAKPDFPGRTVAVVHAIELIGTGKPATLDEVKHKPLAGGVTELGKMHVTKPTFLAVGAANGDKHPDLLVGAADGIKLFHAAGDTFTDATASSGVSGATGAAAAFGDVNGDGKADLLLGGTLYLNDGSGKFTPAKAANIEGGGTGVLAVALLDATGDGKPDAVVLLADGRLLVFENPGAADKQWPKKAEQKLPGSAPTAAVFGDFGDDGLAHVIVVNDDGIHRYPVASGTDAPADFDRLTGERAAGYKVIEASALGGATLTPIDANGDGRTDVLIATEAGTMLLLNRGLGAFFVDPDLGADLATATGAGKGLPLKLASLHAHAGFDRRGDGFQDLLGVTDDGRVLDAANAPQK